jgi:hypothetical protein
MNRIELPVTAGAGQGSDTEFNLVTWQPEQEAASAEETAVTASVPLMTRRIKPGTSIRRLRNHRSAWPRRQ